MGLDRARIVALVDGYLDALRAGDPSRIVALYSANARLEDPAGSPPREGREAIGSLYEVPRKISLVERVGDVSVFDTFAGFQFRIELQSQSELAQSAGGVGLMKLLITEIMSFSDAGEITSMVAVPDFDVFRSASEIDDQAGQDRSG